MHDGIPGHGLRDIREGLGLTLKQVEAQSRRISQLRQNREYVFTAGRLSQVENSYSLPSVYKLAALSEIYGTPYHRLLRIYGIEVGEGGTLTVAPGNGGSGRNDREPQEAELTSSPAWV
jgi:transcriptional regulator with XRE-family HTH domain